MLWIDTEDMNNPFDPSFSGLGMADRFREQQDADEEPGLSFHLPLSAGEFGVLDLTNQGGGGFVWPTQNVSFPYQWASQAKDMDLDGGTGPDSLEPTPLWPFFPSSAATGTPALRVNPEAIFDQMRQGQDPASRRYDSKSDGYLNVITESLQTNADGSSARKEASNAPSVLQTGASGALENVNATCAAHNFVLPTQAQGVSQGVPVSAAPNPLLLLQTDLSQFSYQERALEIGMGVQQQQKRQRESLDMSQLASLIPGSSSFAEQRKATATPAQVIMQNEQLAAAVGDEQPQAADILAYLASLHASQQDQDPSPAQSAQMTRLRELMTKSEETQKALQEWDKKNGLPKSHSCTMVNTSRSRKQLQVGKILPKWDGSPLITEDSTPSAKSRRKPTRKKKAADAASGDSA